MTSNGYYLAVIFRAVKKMSLNLIFCLLLIPIPLQASPLISAVYQHADGSELSIMIEIGSPPPTSLILVQKFPPGTAILLARPPAQKVDPAKGEAKWLFRDLKPGTMTISFSLDRSVSSAEISGQIRFKSPGRKEMESLPVGKP